uniref:Uncharacterized protein n=1 Tax=Tanacetum cinerariifolium TaxID=118510 RepID=A0A6L2MLX8_TANCI|nr:hypothetical protein [Tanacetum cinerariifolium]
MSFHSSYGVFLCSSLYAMALGLPFLSCSSSLFSFGLSSWESLCSLGCIVMVLIEPWIWVEHCGSSIGLCQREMSFHQALDLIFELDEAVVKCTRDILRQIDFLDRLSKLPWVVLTFIVIDGEIDMVIKDLDLEPKFDAMIRDFLYPSWWKELSKETSSKILPCGDGSCWKMFKPIASLIVKGKLKQAQARSFPIFTVKVKSKRYYVVLYGDLNVIPVALMARFGVISKSTDKIHVSYGG